MMMHPVGPHIPSEREAIASPSAGARPPSALPSLLRKQQAAEAMTEKLSPTSVHSSSALAIPAVPEVSVESKPRKAPGHAKALFACRRSLKAIGVTFMAVMFLMGLVSSPGAWIDNQGTQQNLVSFLFLVGLVLVILEDHVNVNKGAVMLMVSVSMWAFLAAGYHPHESKEGHDKLDRAVQHGLEEVGQLILFLLPAMGVVESIDHFGGFSIVTRFMTRAAGDKKMRLMPLLCVLVFFLSAVIDNLTATIVALKLLRHVVRGDRHLRHTIGGLVVIAANAGGAWSPVGDVTTTMLWLGDKISVGSTIRWLFLPSFVAGVFPMVGLYLTSSRSPRAAPDEEEEPDAEVEEPEVRAANILVLVLGIGCIFMVPVLKMITGLPPYMGMLLALGILWFVTDTAAFQDLNRKLDEPRRCEDGEIEIGASPVTPASPRHDPPGSVVEALHQMDLTGLLFFAGVLLAVGALDACGVLEKQAELIVKLCGGSAVWICTLLGISSAVVDNVPLVQAAIDMFGDTPRDDPLWQLVALAAGTGGSVLSVGSIAGVTLMTMEGVGYIWYLRRISFWALVGFAGGIATYQMQRALFA